jgi:hypothetical protein
MTHASSTKKITNQINQNTNKRREVTDEEGQLVCTLHFCCSNQLLSAVFSVADPWNLLWYQSARLKTTFDDIEDLKRQERSRQQRISNARDGLAAAEKELQDLQPYEPPRAEMVSLVTLFPWLFCFVFVQFSVCICNHLSRFMCLH